MSSIVYIIYHMLDIMSHITKYVLYITYVTLYVITEEGPKGAMRPRGSLRFRENPDSPSFKLAPDPAIARREVLFDRFV